MSRRGVIRRAVAALLLWAALALPNVASAHPRLTRSSPAAAAILSTTPEFIRLWFSEVPELPLTSVSLRDGAGNAIVIGAVARDDSSRFGVVVAVHWILLPGVYTVRWNTAAADGHLTHGNFSFTVQKSGVVRSTTDGAPGLAVPTPVEPTPGRDTLHRESATAAGVSFTAVRAALLLSLLVVVGAVLFQFIVLPGAHLDVATRERAGVTIATVSASCAVVLIVMIAIKLVLQVHLLNAASGATVGGATLGMVVRATRWGMGWQLQMLGALLAGAALLVARRSRRGWVAAAIAAALLVVTPALGGHAASSPKLTTMAIVADALHVLGASGWLGGLLLMAVVIRTMARVGGASRWTDIANVVNAFSPMALVSAAVLAASGGFAAWLHLGSLTAVWSTGYGRVLLLKLAVVVLTLAAGAFNWRRLRPRLGSESATATIARSAAFELSLGLGVIVVTAVLVALETPIQ